MSSQYNVSFEVLIHMLLYTHEYLVNMDNDMLPFARRLIQQLADLHPITSSTTGKL